MQGLYALRSAEKDKYIRTPGPRWLEVKSKHNLSSHEGFRFYSKIHNDSHLDNCLSVLSRQFLCQMRRDIFLPDESILLVGEGNFSFSVSLLKDLHISSKLTTSCFENVPTSTQNENINVLKDLGARVMIGIDATKLHEQDDLKSQRYDKVIFNFPHTGGKMKIHLNRALLQLFFLSASKLLNIPGGQIIVTLCCGQGADFEGKRCWGDSWQIVEMAGHANLVLVECSLFDWSLFPKYKNVGYRSQEKGFHSAEALVHIFSVVEPYFNLRVENNFEYGLKETSGVNEEGFCQFSDSRCVYNRRIKQNIIRNNFSAPYYVLSKLYKTVSSKVVGHNVIEEDVSTQTSMLDESLGIFSQWKQTSTDLLLYSGYAFNKLEGDFQMAPVSIHTFLIGHHNYDIFMEFLQDLKSLFNKPNVEVFVENNQGNLAFHPQSICQIFIWNNEAKQRIFIADVVVRLINEVAHKIILIRTDIIASFFFGLNSWRQLWASTAKVQMQGNSPTLHGICPYPITYTFDLSFIVNDMFTEERMFEILWNIAGEFLVHVEKIDEFVSPAEGWRSKCYRLSYSSYDKPMFREGVYMIHQNVIGQVLEKTLAVVIR